MSSSYISHLGFKHVFNVKCKQQESNVLNVIPLQYKHVVSVIFNINEVT